MDFLKINPRLSIPGAHFVENYHFTCGNCVPIFEVETVHTFNKMIGYSKYRNKDKCEILYRGEAHLHEKLLPSLFRKSDKLSHAPKNLAKLMDKIIKDSQLPKTIGLIDIKNHPSFCKKKKSREDWIQIEKILKVNKIILEGMLQHYGISTRFVDVVDNHWIALWMGNHICKKFKQAETYCRYVQRDIKIADAIRMNAGEMDKQWYQYILLIAVPIRKNYEQRGIWSTSDFIQVDLREALPSLFLRPHAQHGIVVRKRVKDEGATDGYDLATNVIGILKIRFDYCSEWMGGGQLLCQDNLFPPPAFDLGYDILLKRTDIFCDEFCNKDTLGEIVKYV